MKPDSFWSAFTAAFLRFQIQEITLKKGFQGVTLEAFKMKWEVIIRITFGWLCLF
jgi:hypothetical protein